MSERRFPLQWPETWERTEEPKRASFIVSLAKARNHLFDNLRLMRATDVILSSNAPVNQDGQIRARVGDDVGDNGVAVYFTYDGERQQIACDRWDLLPDNMRAIGLTVEAIRGIERWGSTSMVKAVMSGFVALPPGMPAIAASSPWWVVLGVDPTADRKQVDRAYRELLYVCHPDHGGTDEAFRLLQDAYNDARKARLS